MKTPSFANNLKRRISRYFLGFFSLTGMLFIFQACYGTPQDFGLDVLIHGQVMDESDHKGIGQIEVRVAGLDQYTQTDENGNFSLSCPEQDSYRVTFMDVDGTANGSYEAQDTTGSPNPESKTLLLNVLLKEK